MMCQTTQHCQMWQNNSRSAGHQRKYDTTRAFFITVLAISVLVVWTVITGPDSRSRKLIRRGDYLQRKLHIANESEISKPVNLEVSVPHIYCQLQIAEGRFDSAALTIR